MQPSNDRLFYIGNMDKYKPYLTLHNTPSILTKPPFGTMYSSISKEILIFFLGYVYLLFESEKSVKNLLANCTHDFSNGGDWYYKISSRRMRCKEV